MATRTAKKLLSLNRFLANYGGLRRFQILICIISLHARLNQTAAESNGTEAVSTNRLAFALIDSNAVRGERINEPPSATP